MSRKVGVALLGLAVVFSAVYFGTVFNVPIVSNAGEKLWNYAEPAMAKTKNFLEESYQKIFGNGFNSKTGLGESSNSGNESLQTVDPPDITVSMSSERSTYYLGDNPSFEITVTNSGGPCDVDYTAFETQSETGTLHLDSGESEIVTETGRQVKSIGNWNASIDVSATNESGSDYASDTAYFEVDVKALNPKNFIEEDDLKGWDMVYDRLKDAGEWLIDSVKGRISDDERAETMDQFVTSNSEPIEEISNQLKSRHPNDKELQAKEIFYFVLNNIKYDDSISTDPLKNPISFAKMVNYQGVYPVETLNKGEGICVNYTTTLASLYEAAGFDSKIVGVWDERGAHALIILHFPNLKYASYYKDGWMILDPTYADEANWKFGEYHSQNWGNVDTAEVE